MGEGRGRGKGVGVLRVGTDGGPHKNAMRFCGVVCYGLFGKELEATVAQLERADNVLVQRVVDVGRRKVYLALHVVHKGYACSMKPRSTHQLGAVPFPGIVQPVALLKKIVENRRHLGQAVHPQKEGEVCQHVVGLTYLLLGEADDLFGFLLGHGRAVMVPRSAPGKDDVRFFQIGCSEVAAFHLWPARVHEPACMVVESHVVIGTVGHERNRASENARYIGHVLARDEQYVAALYEGPLGSQPQLILPGINLLELGFGSENAHLVSSAGYG